MGGAAASAAAYYMYDQKKTFNSFSFMNASIPAMCAPLAYDVPSANEVAKCKKDILAFIKARRNMAPLMVRLSWHDSGTFEASSNTGGPRACMRFEGGEAAHGANAGL